MTMAAFSIDSKKLLAAALNALTPGMEHICVLPAMTFVKLTRVVNLVQTETSVTAAADDQCPPGSIDLPVPAPAPAPAPTEPANQSGG
jgi:hypothetical protein